jgi:hypothetical protein
MTPEAKTKQKIKKLLDSYGDRVYSYMPVPSGYGKPTIDYLVCFDGLFIGIEAKKPGAKPTERQQGALAAIYAAGGTAFVIDSEESLKILENFLKSVDKWGSAA